MTTPAIISQEDIARVRAAVPDRHARAELTAELCRMNTLAAVKIAGSGHLGSSLSAMDMVVWLYTEVMNTLEVGVESPHRDIYFSSKGHDAPGLYAVLHALGVLPQEKLLLLRRLGGLDGHPDVKIPGVEANTGSLGMGIGKGRGMALGKKLQGHGGMVYVLLGDGELQEGQIYESLQTTAHQKTDNLLVIVDHNKVQSDKYVREITDLLDLEAKFRAFGWHVDRCDGNDMAAFDAALGRLRGLAGPKILIADTIKGRGVSFMEHPQVMPSGQHLYPWHSGAPADEPFQRAWAELLERVNARLSGLGVAPVGPQAVSPRPKPASSVTREYVADAYGAALVELARTNENIVVLDGDLAADCRVRAFEQAYPQRFVENGIAEMDMVSMAGGLARAGMLPVVNTFASFLASRPNEQIYNNASELTKIIYVCHYAGLIPAGPGKSHQSLRDISLFGALPNCAIVQPCNAQETKALLAWCVDESPENCMIRLIIGPSPRRIELPEGYRLTPGRGCVLREGTDAVLFAYGPVMLHEALGAAEILAAKGFRLKVVNMPWLNKIDAAWLAEVCAGFGEAHVLEDHSPVGGLGDALARTVNESGLGLRVRTLGVAGWPACGTPPEVLEHHGLDASSLAKRFAGAGRQGALLATGAALPAGAAASVRKLFLHLEEVEAKLEHTLAYAHDNDEPLPPRPWWSFASARELRWRQLSYVREMREYLVDNPDKNLKLPDFMFVGTPRSASTWCKVVIGNAAPCLFSVDEPMSFSKGFMAGADKYLRAITYVPKRFRACFSYEDMSPEDVVQGEKNPDYLALPVQQVAFIKMLMPELKVLFLVRDPVEAFWSFVKFLYQKDDKAQRLSFDANSTEGQKLIAHRLHKFRCYWSYVEQIPVWRGFFKESLTIFHEDIERAPAEAMEQMLGFLGAAAAGRAQEPQLFERINETKDRAAVPADLIPALREAFQEEYAGWRDLFGREPKY